MAKPHWRLARQGRVPTGALENNGFVRFVGSIDLANAVVRVQNLYPETAHRYATNTQHSPPPLSTQSIYRHPLHFPARVFTYMSHYEKILQFTNVRYHISAKYYTLEVIPGVLSMSDRRFFTTPHLFCQVVVLKDHFTFQQRENLAGSTK